MHATRIAVTVPVNASGDATVYSAGVTGRLIDIQYVPDGATPYDNTADFTITGKITGRALLSKSNVAAAFINAPRQPTHDTSGTALLYAAGGAAVADHICLAGEEIKIVIAQGGNAKTGLFYITVA